MTAASEKPSVLLLGVSTRAMSRSAVAAGYPVVSLDYFADSDQPDCVEAYSLARDFHLPLSIPNLLTAARELLSKVQVVVPCAGLENIQGFLADSQVQLWGNNPEAAGSVRDFTRLQKILPGTGVRLPRTYTYGDVQPKEGGWLVKDITHNGGTGVKRWRKGRKWGSAEIIQEFIQGELCSAAFLANGCEAKLVGLTRQYAGIKELGATGFLWCGNAAPFLDEAISKPLGVAANTLTAAFGLRGWNGIDFIVKDGIPYLIEVNPRWSGSVELFERVCGFNALELHRISCEGELPKIKELTGQSTCWAKGIVYARKQITIKTPSVWPDGDYADIPHMEEVIPRRYPVCSVFSRGSSLENSWDGVLISVRRLEKELYLG
jgi:predicted ATP-grasp superfamily ATP-dependent carboligase